MEKKLKGKYFPHVDFLQCEFRTQPLVVQRSIWAAKGLLNKGYSWLVGNGHSISILDTPWLLIDKPCTVEIACAPKISKVVDLIYSYTSIWNTKLMLLIFAYHDPKKFSASHWWDMGRLISYIGALKVMESIQ